MHRFYCANANFSQKHLLITDANEIHHIKDVLRLKKGALIQIFNGQSQEADVIIDSIGTEGLKVSVQSMRQAAINKGKVILACAPPKKDKFEWIIEKCTELGVDEIIPLKTRRGEVVFSADKMAGKLARFNKVVMNAAKQSKRVVLPVVHPMTDLSKVLKNLDPQGLHLFPSLNDHPTHIKEVLFKKLSFPNALIGNLENGPPIKTFGGDITIFIGPEGDFTPEEVRMAQEAGCIPVSLGNTVLKVETAAIAVLSLVCLLKPHSIPFGIDNTIPRKV